MSAGRVWPAEWREVKDPVSGITLRRLTNYMGHSHHLYFTNPGWYADTTKLLFGSDRANLTNLYSLDLASGSIMQLTDLEPVAPPFEVGFLGTCVNPKKNEAYFWHARRLVAIDLDTLETRTLWEMPEGFRQSMINVTADGRCICAGLFEDLSDRFRIDYQRGYVGFAETWEAHPLSRIQKIPVDGRASETVWEEKTWIGHVNTSPTQPNLLTFCHEGPWNRVDNRIWGFDLSTRKAWKIRPRERGENPGHEYWFADGVRIGYHGRTAARPDDPGRAFLGSIRYDNTDKREYDFSANTGHIHSNGMSMIAGDGGKVIRLWKWNGKSYDGPRALAEHRSTMNLQKCHPHPRFTPDGTHVLFTTDWTGYCNMYLAPVPEFETLPEVKD